MQIVVMFVSLFLAAGAFFMIANWWTQRRPLRRTKKDVERTLEDFLKGQGGPYDWDDFLTFPIADPRLELVRVRCAAVDWMTGEGRGEIRRQLELRRGEAT